MADLDRPGLPERAARHEREPGLGAGGGPAPAGRTGFDPAGTQRSAGGRHAGQQPPADRRGRRRRHPGHAHRSTTNATIAPPPAEAPATPPAAETQASASAPPAPAYPAPTAYAPPVTHAATVVYEQLASSRSSAWSTVGTFTGGALVGSILGYAIGDDHDGWHPDRDDVDDTIDQIDRNRDDARRERQDYADSAREDRQDFRNQSREDRQNAASQYQQSNAQRDEQRRAQAKNAQAPPGLPHPPRASRSRWSARVRHPS